MAEDVCDAESGEIGGLNCIERDELGMAQDGRTTITVSEETKERADAATPDGMTWDASLTMLLDSYEEAEWGDNSDEHNGVGVEEAAEIIERLDELSRQVGDLPERVEDRLSGR